MASDASVLGKHRFNRSTRELESGGTIAFGAGQLRRARIEREVARVLAGELPGLRALEAGEELELEGHERAPLAHLGARASGAPRWIVTQPEVVDYRATSERRAIARVDGVGRPWLPRAAFAGALPGRIDLGIAGLWLVGLVVLVVRLGGG